MHKGKLGLGLDFSLLGFSCYRPAVLSTQIQQVIVLAKACFKWPQRQLGYGQGFAPSRCGTAGQP